MRLETGMRRAIDERRLIEALTAPVAKAAKSLDKPTFERREDPATTEFTFRVQGRVARKRRQLVRVSPSASYVIIDVTYTEPQLRDWFDR